MSTLEVSNLVVRYGQVTAVHGIDLRLEQGQVATLLGSNGAGKTSTLNALSRRAHSVRRDDHVRR